MDSYAARLDAAARGRQRTEPPAWGRVERGASGWAPPIRGERRSFPPRPPLHGGAAAGRRSDASAEGRGGVREQRVAGAGAVSGWSGADGCRGGGDARRKAQQEEARGGVPWRGLAAGAGEPGFGSVDGAKGVPGSVLAGKGGSEVGTKRQPAAPPARHPPLKRPAVSARRRFPPGCGRDAAAPLGRADGGSRFQAARAVVDISHALMDDAAPALALAGCSDVVLPGTESLGSVSATALNKAPAADGVGPVVKVGHHVLSSRLLAKRRTVSATRSIPPGCLRDVVPLPPAQVTEEEMLADVDCSAADEGHSQVVASPRDGPTDGAVAQDEELEEGEIPPAKLAHELVGSQVSVTVILHQPAPCEHETSVPATIAVEASVNPSSDDKIGGSRIQYGGKTLQCEVAKDFKVTISSAWSPCHVAAESLAEGPPQQQLRNTWVSEIAKIDKASSDKISGSRIQCGEKRPSCEVSKDFINSSARSSCPVAPESSSEGSSQEQLRGGRVSQISKMDKANSEFAVEIPMMHRTSSDLAVEVPKMGNASSDLAVEVPKMGKASSDLAVEIPKMGKASSDLSARVSDEGAPMRRKVMLTARKTVRPPKVIKKSAVDTRHAPFSWKEKEKEKESELGRNATKHEIEDTDEFTKGLVQQALRSSEKRPTTQQMDAATVTGYFGPRKRVKVKHLTNSPMKFNPKFELGRKEKLADKADSNLDDDDLLKGLAVREGKLEFYLKDASPARSMKHERQYGVQNADARIKVKMMCRRFEIICRTIAQAVDQRSVKVRRIDLAADKAMKELPDYSKPGPFVGKVPGVEVGDGFLYRVQLAIVGLHRPYQGGIDWTKDNNDNLIAISVVASGGYPDELSSSGELVYTGSGGKLAGRHASGDEKLERGNIALKNCIKWKSPVRVIHGFKGLNNEECSHSRAKEITTFTYDGLYHVVDCWTEGQPGSKVFKFKLQRIPGQPELPYGRKTVRS
ncbi:hypothetical protein QOZ80_8BG0657860 [Eleusine coracana subsp. coracana]|nr:hypothetical protein QOZ80_8BG0657860 [Eleusine coracana subsp. coracana]